MSPSKTFEGYIGGIAGSFGGMLIMEVAAPGLPWVGVLAKLTSSWPFWALSGTYALPLEKAARNKGFRGLATRARWCNGSGRRPDFCISCNVLLPHDDR